MKKILNILNFAKAKKIFILLFLLIIYSCICALNYTQAISHNISDSVFRLHVIANSDNKDDQELKYKVRDSLLTYMNTLCSNCNSKEEVITIASNHLEDFQKIATETIQKNGYSYEVNVEISKCSFPTKTYGDISLPAGIYDALRVKIGNAKGQNWWCVMFPSLCFIDISNGIVPEDSKEELKNILTDEEYNIISNESNINYKFKFKLIEFFAKNGLLTAKN